MRLRFLAGVAATAALTAGCAASTTTTTTVITATAASPVQSTSSPLTARVTTTSTTETGPDDESSAGVPPRTLAQQLAAVATQYAGPYLALRHEQLRGVEYIGADHAHPGWQTVLVTYTGRATGRSDTSADLFLYLVHGLASWTVVRAQ